jgi:hypothetical protein
MTQFPPAAPNENGVYPDQHEEVLAQSGRSNAAVQLCHCDDGLYRCSTSMHYSYGGFSGPIFVDDEGFPTYRAALDAGTQRLLDSMSRFHRESLPQSVRAELDDLKNQIAGRIIQPSLF